MKKIRHVSFFIAGIVLVFVLVISCSKKTDDPNPDTTPPYSGKTYVIAQGAHETSNPPVLKTTTALKFKVRFDNSAIYTTIDPLNQDDTNKLWGLSDCGSFHQTNSARFGWRWVDQNLELMAYCYIDGIRPEPVVVDTIALNTVNTCSIAFNTDKYIFTVNDTSIVEVPKNCHYTGPRYQLYPYFGGDETAPHEIKIWIEEL